MSTHTLFFHSNLLVDSSNNNFRKVITTKSIKSGTLLALEHVIANQNLNTFVMYDKNLYENLYPRTKNWSTTILQQNMLKPDSDISEKVKRNKFNLTSENIDILGDKISSFNSSLDFNACTRIHKIKLEVPIYFMSIVAINDIPENTEVTILYKFPNHAFNLDEFDKKLKEYMMYQQKKTTDNIFEKIVCGMMTKYMKTMDFERVLLINMRANLGYYYFDGILMHTKNSKDIVSKISETEIQLKNKIKELVLSIDKIM